ncbi:MAG: TIGR02587 family membrane protein [Nostocaceae cyanobacterium]|nr:TIGR02587 family membrane protein [Nostocaceae cyanobacterium]
MGAVKKRRKHAWVNEIDDLIRGACGGFLFGIPLLYTMEVWWIGSLVEPARMMIALVITYIVVFLVNRTAGFRTIKDNSVIEAAMDSVEAIAIGIVCTTFMLILLREITLQVPLDEALGKILFESVPFTLGIALSQEFLSGDRNLDMESNNNSQNNDKLNATIADIGATLLGATVVAFNIAPTDEVAMLAMGVTGVWLPLIIATSLIVSYAIVFVSGFANQSKRMQQRGVFQRPLSETILAYLLALLAAAFMLWFFERISFEDPWTMWLKYTLILGLPASIGGAAGRLAI